MSQEAVSMLSTLIDKVSKAIAVTIETTQQNINGEASFLVSGYIRSNQNKKMIIPDGVKLLCTDFNGHYFNKSGILPIMLQRFDLFKLLISNDSSLNNMNRTKLLYQLS